MEIATTENSGHITMQIASIYAWFLRLNNALISMGIPLIACPFKSMILNAGAITNNYYNNHLNNSINI